MGHSRPTSRSKRHFTKMPRRRFLGAAATALGATFLAYRASGQVPATTSDSGYAPPGALAGPRYTPAVREEYVASLPNAIIPRSAWTNAGPAKSCHPMNGVNLLTFHHDGNPGGFYDVSYWQTARYLESIRQFHVQNKFEDIGYHFAIDRAGRIWQLRSVLYRGEHVRNLYSADHRLLHKWNDHNVGVVVLGNFMEQAPTEAQRQQICRFGNFLRKQYQLSIAQVKVHQELVTTECPGIHMRPYMDEVRKQALI